jgi:MinD-like ATPase involved in chromosome partitioning or flagellar assembly
MSATNGRLVVNVDSPSGRHRLDLPEDARVEDLVPSLVEVCEGSSESAGWTLMPMGEGSLSGERTLAECGLFAGAVLVLVAPAEPGTAEQEAPVPSVSDLARKLRTRLQPVPRMLDTNRMSDADYVRLLDSAIAASPSGASSVVAVMSAHAGAGTTTVAVLLATLLSNLRPDQVVAVDACPHSGALSHWMAPENSLSGDAYRSLFDPPPTPEQVRAALVKVGPVLAILPASSDQSNKPAPDEAAWTRLIEHLRHLHNTVILDCGAGFTKAASRAALSAADHVVLVTKSTPGDLDRLGPTISSIRSRGRTVAVVVNRGPKRARARQSEAGVQQLTLAYEPQPAARLKTRGFAWSEAPDSWQESVRELAAMLVGSGGSAEDPPRAFPAEPQENG